MIVLYNTGDRWEQSIDIEALRALVARITSDKSKGLSDLIDIRFNEEFAVLQFRDGRNVELDELTQALPEADSEAIAELREALRQAMHCLAEPL